MEERFKQFYFNKPEPLSVQANKASVSQTQEPGSPGLNLEKQKTQLSNVSQPAKELSESKLTETEF